MSAESHAELVKAARAALSAVACDMTVEAAANRESLDDLKADIAGYLMALDEQALEESDEDEDAG